MILILGKPQKRFLFSGPATKIGGRLTGLATMKKNFNKQNVATKHEGEG